MKSDGTFTLRALVASALIFPTVVTTIGCGGETDEPLAVDTIGAALAAPSCGNNQVPAMTGSATPSGVVTRSGDYSSSYPAWRAFDDDHNSMWISKTWETPAWIGYEWEDGPRTVTRYAIHYTNGRITTRAPKDWTFEGYNGTAWDVLDTRTEETGWAGSERREYSVATPGAYSKYRINVTDDNDSRSGVVVISMGRLELTQDCD